MGLLNQKSKFKVPPPTIRKEVVVVSTPKANKPKSLSSASSSKSNAATGRLRVPSPGSGSRPSSPYPPSSDEKSRKRRLASSSSAQGRAAHRPSPAVSDRVSFDTDDSSDDDGAWEDALDTRKRRKQAHDKRRVDLTRRLAHPALSDGGDKSGKENGGGRQEMCMIHAADVASLDSKCVPLLGAIADEVAVELQYPGSRQRERYELVWGKDKIDAVKDIKSVVKYMAEVYLDEDEAEPFLNQTNGILRQLERASSEKVKDLKMFTTALDDFNERLLALLEDGTVGKNLTRRHNIHKHLVAFILDQIYDRTVAPKVELLLKYENGTDNVYGELLHPLVSEMLVEQTQMTSDQVFVDLGSGVGNVALQAALEIGCESWGCEMMDNACNLAEAQRKEFAARCRLWGLAPGRVRLMRGDFRSNARINEVLKRADVILVNNQAFTSQLNDDLVRMFLDLKTGCKVISLKSFVHDHKSASHNINDVGSTIFDVESLTYPENYVSWTGAAGTYCVSTKK